MYGSTMDEDHTFEKSDLCKLCITNTGKYYHNCSVVVRFKPYYLKPIHVVQSETLHVSQVP